MFPMAVILEKIFVEIVSELRSEHCSPCPFTNSEFLTFVLDQNKSKK